MVAASSSAESNAVLYPTSLSRRQSPRRPYGTVSFLHFFFRRVTRSGPKLLLYLALLLASSFLIINHLPSNISDSIVGNTSHLWQFRPASLGGGRIKAPSKPPGENNDHDALVGGGLRVVVFGENDLATVMPGDIPADTVSGMASGISWTCELCIELGCTTYLSHVPAVSSSRRSLTANELYGAIVDDLVRDALNQTAAGDYSFVQQMYPAVWEAPDLNAQVADFLSRPPPTRPPKETVWIFSFGMWDVWSLAAFPYSQAESIVAAIISDIFTNVEALYDAAHNPLSVAFSNYSSTPLVLADDATTAQQTGAIPANEPISVVRRGHGVTDLPWEDSSSEPFRVVIPLLLDPSLVPGWHLERPEAPPLHTKSEQLRSAVRLTRRWNDLMIREANAWSKKGVMVVHPDSQLSETASVNVGVGNEGSGVETKHSQPPPNVSARQRRDALAESKSDGDGNSDANNNGTPGLYRDAIVFRPSDYILDAIIDGQLQVSKLSDKRGFGKFSKSDRFLEVDTPCFAPNSTPRSSTAKITIIEHIVGGIKEKSPPASAAHAAAAVLEANTTSRSSSSLARMCEQPDNYLFLTPFSLGKRAIEELGRLSASLVRAKRHTRQAWEKSRQSTFENDREPASWKEYHST